MPHKSGIQLYGDTSNQGTSPGWSHDDHVWPAKGTAIRSITMHSTARSGRAAAVAPAPSTGHVPHSNRSWGRARAQSTPRTSAADPPAPAGEAQGHEHSLEQFLLNTGLRRVRPPAPGEAYPTPHRSAAAIGGDTLALPGLESRKQAGLGKEKSKKEAWSRSPR